MSSVLAAAIGPEVLRHVMPGHGGGGGGEGVVRKEASRPRPIPARMSPSRPSRQIKQAAPHQNTSSLASHIDEASSGIGASLRANAARTAARSCPERKTNTSTPHSQSRSHVPTSKFSIPDDNAASVELFKALDRTGTQAAAEAYEHMVGTPPRPQHVLTRTTGKRPSAAKRLLRGTSSHDVVAVGMQVDGPLTDGLNGAYLCRDASGGKWIFKPLDEEGFKRPEELEDDEREETQHDVVVLDGQTRKLALRRGVVHGDTVKKEEAAYKLDHAGFAGVPQTFCAHILLENGKGESQYKFGSLQQYVPHVTSAEEMGPSFFNIEDVHRIGVLDIRLLNLDRHLGNLLVAAPQTSPPALTNSKSQGQGEEGPNRTGGYRLIPIDHGFILPDFRHTGDVNFEWLHWKQCKEPFSPETLAYIDSLNPLADALALKELNIRDEEVLTSLTTTLLLQKGAAKGLTLFELGSIVQRPHFGTKSTLEKIVDEAVRCTALELRGSPPDSAPGHASAHDINHLEEGLARSLTEGKDGIHVPAGSPDTDDTSSLATSPARFSTSPGSSNFLIPPREGMKRISSYNSNCSDEGGAWPPDGGLGGAKATGPHSSGIDAWTSQLGISLGRVNATAKEQSKSSNHAGLADRSHGKSHSSLMGLKAEQSALNEKPLDVFALDEESDETGLCQAIGPAFEPFASSKSSRAVPIETKKTVPRVTFACSPRSPEIKKQSFASPPRRNTKPKSVKYRDSLDDLEAVSVRNRATSCTSSPRDIPASDARQGPRSELKRSQSLASFKHQAANTMLKKLFTVHTNNPAKAKGVLMTPSKSSPSLLALENTGNRPSPLYLPKPKAKLALQFEQKLENGDDFGMGIPDASLSPAQLGDKNLWATSPRNRIDEADDESMDGPEWDDASDSSDEQQGIGDHECHEFPPENHQGSEWGEVHSSIQELPNETGSWVRLYTAYIMQAIEKETDAVLRSRASQGAGS